ncbi:MAG TPA: M15 family metallopeptidase [Polyangiaceae bacterium]|nr:M15 family metallopeptidase [Polyangiaceae bacterium]
MRRSSSQLFAFLIPLAAALALALPIAKNAEADYRGCRYQKPQAFLIRKNFMIGKALDGRKANQAIRYRVEHYGRVEGAPYEQLNERTAYSQAKSVHFMGLPLLVHEKIAPALACVERRIKKDCTKSADRYHARAVGGFRTENSYRGAEVSNHLFGIAIDIDPNRNPCCGCVAPWPEHKACQGSADSVFERTELTRCWIDTFERYGFYWLGRDPQLRDTMHFEFLGNPDRILPD